MAFQHNLVLFLLHRLGTLQLVAYISPANGQRVDCFIGDCFDLPWLLDRIYIVGTLRLHPIHAFEFLERLKRHNSNQRVLNDYNPQDNNIPGE